MVIPYSHLGIPVLSLSPQFYQSPTSSSVVFNISKRVYLFIVPILLFPIPIFPYKMQETMCMLLSALLFSFSTVSWRSFFLNIWVFSSSFHRLHEHRITYKQSPINGCLDCHQCLAVTNNLIQLIFSSCMGLS